MAIIPGEIIDEVRSRADIVEVISGYIPLKKAGANYRALCPFHQEKTPSFNVNPARQIFHCFGCGEGGNAITFVMKFENMPFPEAVRMLAGQVGVTIEYKEEKGRGEKEALYNAMEAAAQFYHNRLLGEDSSSAVGRYLEKRGLDREMVITFRLGWAPDAWDALYTSLEKAGFNRKTIETAGLCKEASSGNMIDRFRARLMFPTWNFGGKVIAFGGRIIGGARKDAPKYINSPETPIYSKSATLYGLNLAKQAARREGALIVVEGYMDVIALAVAGVENCAAVAGVALTVRQAEMIKRVCDGVVLLFDADEAGMAAVKKSAPILFDRGLKVKVLSLPDAKDPDEFIAVHGRDRFQGLVKEAVELPQFIIDTALAGADLSTVEGRVDAAREAIPFLRMIKDNIERSEYIQSLAQRAGLDVKVLDAETGRPAPEGRPPSGPPQAGKTSARHKAEKILIRILLDRPEYLDNLAVELTAEHFDDPGHRAMFELVREARRRGIEAAADIVNLSDDDRVRTSLVALSVEENLLSEEGIEQMVEDCARRVRYRPETRRRSLAEMKEAAKKGAAEKFRDAEKKYIESRNNKL